MSWSKFLLDGADSYHIQMTKSMMNLVNENVRHFLSVIRLPGHSWNDEKSHCQFANKRYTFFGLIM